MTDQWDQMCGGSEEEEHASKECELEAAYGGYKVKACDLDEDCTCCAEEPA